MAAYKDQFRTLLLENDTLTVEDTVYISGFIPDLTNPFYLKVVNIYASPDQSSSIKYYLLQNGCPTNNVSTDQLTVDINGFGNETRFPMKVFQIGNSNTTYLSAEFVICTDDCAVTCNSQLRSQTIQPVAGNTATFLDAVTASVPCGGDFCADDEYCDYSDTCRCNRTFYTFTRGSQPSPYLTCDGEYFNIQVSKCWLEANGYNTSDIGLNSPNSECWAVREIVDGRSEMAIYRPLTKYDCNTDTEVNSTHVTYINQLYIFAQTDPIRTQDDVVMNVSCSYPLDMFVSLYVPLHPIIGSAVINGPTANASYSVSMTAYKDYGFTTVLSDSDTLNVEDIIYISVVVPDLDVYTFNHKVVNIYASPTNSSDIKYYLLQNGCPASAISTDQLTVDSNGFGNEARFAMEVFKIASSNTVFLFAELELCTGDCAMTCGSPPRSQTIQPVSGTTSSALHGADYTYYAETSSAGVTSSVPCGSDFCADDEYCDNDVACMCNTTLFTDSGNFPSPNLTCDGGYFNIQVSKCWLEANGYNTSDIRLNSAATNCWAVKQVVDGLSQMTIHRPLTTSDCNTYTEMNSTHVTYTNQLYIFAQTYPIRTQNDAVMNVSCYYPRQMTVSLNVTLHPITGIVGVNHFAAGTSYTAVMAAYKDNAYTVPLSEEDPLTVEDTIYLFMIIPDMDASSFNLSVVNLYASPTNSSDTKYYLLKNGCPASDVSTDQLTVTSNGVGIESRFAMQVFKITSSNIVYLFAELRLCTNDCTVTCSSQPRSQAISGITTNFLYAMTASVPCGSEFCAADEFCDNNAACRCNTTLYTLIGGSLPSPNFTCTGAKFNIQMSKCWLEANGYNTSDIRLNSTEYFAVREVVDGTSEMTIHRPLMTSDSNTEAVVNSTHITYTNQLYIFAQAGPIITRNDAVMNISCTYPLYMDIKLNVTLWSIIGPTVINGTTSNASYSVSMTAYKDNGFTALLSDFDTLNVEDIIYISVVIPDLDVYTFNHKVVNLYASPDNSSDTKYYLLKDGCPSSDVSADQLTVTSNGIGIEALFAMKVFKIASSNIVYLFAELELCTDDCATTCDSQSRSQTIQPVSGTTSSTLHGADYTYYAETSSARVTSSVPCGSDFCAADEYCDNNTVCRCNTTLYTDSGNFPSPNLTCDGGYFNIQMSKCWLEANGYNTSDIRLNSAVTNCWAVKQIVDGISLMTIHRPLTTSDCNTYTEMNSTHVTYTNQLYIFAQTYPIQTQNDAVMNVSCSYPRQMTVSLNVTLSPILGIIGVNHFEVNASYTAVMATFTDNTYTVALTEDDTLTVEDTIYLSAKVPDLDANTFNLTVVNIYASPTESTDIKYYLLQNGCPSTDISTDQLTVDSNGLGIESRFAMKVFQIISSNTVYLFAELRLCTDDCVVTCSSLSRSQTISGITANFLYAVAASGPCGSDFCAADEFCNNSTVCMCNTTLYTDSGSQPSPNFTCTGGMFNIQMSKCWLEAHGYNTSDVRLNSTDANCSAVSEIVDGISEMTIYRPLTKYDCNTDTEVNSTHITYTNQLNIFADMDPIRIINDAVMNVSCSYPLSMDVRLNMTLHPVLGTLLINGTTADASYVALMMAYKDQFTTLLSETDPLTVEDTVYISVLIPDLDVNTFNLSVVNIYASPTNSSDTKYYLLQNGCPSSQISTDQLTVTNNGISIESRFAMKVFKISSSNTVYLFAELRLCTDDCTICGSRSISDFIQPIAGNTNSFLGAGFYDFGNSSASMAASVPCESGSCVAADEYCGYSTACLCNTTLYTDSGSQPSPNFTCTGGKFNIQMPKCWLEVNGYNISNVRLNSTNSECWAVREFVDGIWQMTIHRPLMTSDCNTYTEINTTHVTYTNQLNIFAQMDPIRIANDAVMNVSCSYPLSMDVRLNVTLHPILGSTVINSTTADASYVALMMAYKDQFTTLLSENDPLTVEDVVYISVLIPDLDSNIFNLSVVNIYASPTNSSTIRYYLLQDGCPSSDISTDQLTVTSNGLGIEARFAMKAFKITSFNTVYLYAELRLCTNDCTTCGSRSISDFIQPIAGNNSSFLNAGFYDFGIRSASMTSSVPCGSDFCAADEYCDNSTACMCNTTLYTDSGILPAFTCIGGRFNIQVSTCWLEAHGYNTSDIRLNSMNPECWAVSEFVDGIWQMTIYRPLITSDCNTYTVMNSTHITYINQLNIFARADPIRTQNDAVMNVSCSYPLYMDVRLNVTLHPIIGSMPNANYSVYMMAYKDNQFTTPLSNSYPLFVQDTVYVSVSIPDLDANAFSLKVLSMYASPTIASSIKYYLLQEGCPANNVSADQLTVDNNGVGIEARFAMKVFQITGSNTAYLYAEVVLCNNNCNSTWDSQSITVITQSIAGNSSIFMEAVAESVPCGSDSCAGDEFCNNITDCQCNTTLYTDSGNLPSPSFACTETKLNIQVSKCWLEAHGYSTSNVRLNSTNSECFAVREVVDGRSEMTLHRPLISSDCNTDTVVNSSHVTYTNRLYISSRKAPVQIVNDFVMNISCTYPLPLNVSLNVTVHTVVGPTEINGPTANVRYSMYIIEYTDEVVTSLSHSDPSHVEDTVDIAVNMPDLDAYGLNLKMVNMYASPGSSSSTKYNLIQDGCPVRNLSAGQLTMESNGVGNETRLATKVFQITNSDRVSLAAKVALCVGNCNSTCTP